MHSPSTRTCSATTRLVPQGTSLDFQHADGRVHLTASVVQGHAMIELALA